MSEKLKPDRIVQAHIYAGENFLLLIDREGYYAVPRGEAGEADKSISDLINIALWRILKAQLGLDEVELDYLKNRPFKYLGSQHIYSGEHEYNIYDMAVNRSVGHQLPVKLPENGEYVSYGWYSMFHLPENTHFWVKDPVKNLKQGLVRYRGRNPKSEY